MSAMEVSNSTFQCSYQVFLSFRGKDTRYTFTDHLYRALDHAGIHTFRDDDELQNGENIESELTKAIQESKISVIVFSKNYASSRWCLDELLKIVECKKTNQDHEILPVFYHVLPSDVRKQTGCFEEAFAIHEDKFKGEDDETKKQGMEKVKRWRKALKVVAGLAGFPILPERYESQYIQDIVKKIGTYLSRQVLFVPSHIVGIDSLVEDINIWLQDTSSSGDVAAIYGIGGVGKTTIAKILYNQNFDKFKASSFLANIRENCDSHGLISLQRQLISDIMGRKEEIRNADDGITKIEDVICRKRVLIVLDDVDHEGQLTNFLGTRDRLHPGSKIIVTTRLEKLLKVKEVCRRFEVGGLTEDESLHLFNLHAFGHDNPPECFTEPSRQIVKRCGGIPLALNVLGSSLYGESVDVWKSALEQLSTILNPEIHDVLKISFDSLQGDHYKDLFLHIACFFVGKDKDFVITVLDQCQFYTTVGIQHLVNRYLIMIEGNKLRMHQLLQDMGREIVRQESPREPGKRSRVWNFKDSQNILREHSGTESIQGLVLNWNLIKEYSPVESRTNACDDFKPNAFSRMSNITLLQLNYARITEGYENFPKRLRWLSWRGFHQNFIPDNFDMAELVALDMRNSSLVKPWWRTKELGALKILKLSHSHFLEETPDFSGLPNLERLILKYCIKLVELHKSFVLLSKLVILNLKGCKSLRKLPSKFSELKRSLKTLILSGCSELIVWPIYLQEMESLTVICADGNAWATNDLKSRYGMPAVHTSPESTRFSSICLPRCLTTLSLADCNLTANDIPVNLSSLYSLKHLNLSGNPLSNLPGNIRGLSKLETLVLNNCRRLQSLYQLPMNLWELHVLHCTSLTTTEKLPYSLRAQLVHWEGCRSLIEIEGLFQLSPIADIQPKLFEMLGLRDGRYFRRNIVPFITDITAVLKELGLVNDWNSSRNIEVELVNLLSETSSKGSLQVLHEFDILSTFVPGCNIPKSFKIQKIGPAVCFVMPSIASSKICIMSVCIVYDYRHMPGLVGRGNYILIKNKSKKHALVYSPTFFGRPQMNDKMTWCCCFFDIGKYLDGGDEVEIVARINWEVQALVYGVQFWGGKLDKEEGPSNGKPFKKVRITVSPEKRSMAKCSEIIQKDSERKVWGKILDTEGGPSNSNQFKQVSITVPPKKRLKMMMAAPSNSNQNFRKDTESEVQPTFDLNCEYEMPLNSYPIIPKEVRPLAHGVQFLGEIVDTEEGRSNSNQNFRKDTESEVQPTFDLNCEYEMPLNSDPIIPKEVRPLAHGVQFLGEIFRKDTESEVQPPVWFKCRASLKRFLIIPEEARPLACGVQFLGEIVDIEEGPSNSNQILQEDTRREKIWCSTNVMSNHTHWSEFALRIIDGGVTSLFDTESDDIFDWSLGFRDSARSLKFCVFGNGSTPHFGNSKSAAVVVVDAAAAAHINFSDLRRDSRLSTVLNIIGVPVSAICPEPEALIILFS